MTPQQARDLIQRITADIAALGRYVEGKITTEHVVSDVKTRMIAFRCLACGKISAYPEKTGDGRTCAHCNGFIVPIGYAKAAKPYPCPDYEPEGSAR